jgi:hydroxyacylglutathione hydrolase
VSNPEQPRQALGDYQIDTFVTGAPWKENCYLVRHLPSGEQAVLDPGDDAETIISAIAEGGPLRFVLLTHAHHDHVGAVAAICHHFNLPCDLHQADVRLLRHAPMYALRFAGKKIDPPEVVRTFEAAPAFQLGGQAMTVLHTPGHTAGSVCYCLAGAAFTGDTLLHEGVGRTDLPGADANLLKASVTCLLAQLPPETLLLAGHGRPWTAAEARAWWSSTQA